jgi:hypothetical protein
MARSRRCMGCKRLTRDKHQLCRHCWIELPTTLVELLIGSTYGSAQYFLNKFAVRNFLESEKFDNA